jgi:hypothetical protein
VTHVDGQQRYWYDDNGNQVLRMVISGTQVITYLQEQSVGRVEGRRNPTSYP